MLAVPSLLTTIDGDPHRQSEIRAVGPRRIPPGAMQFAGAVIPGTHPIPTGLSNASRVARHAEPVHIAERVPDPAILVKRRSSST